MSKDTDARSNDTKSTTSESHVARTTQQLNAEQIADNVIRRLGQNLRLQNQRIPPLRRCMQCGGDHPTNFCPVITPPPQRPKWCAIEGKWTNHSTEECYYNKGQVKERPYQPNLQYQQNPPANQQYQQPARNPQMFPRYAPGQVNSQAGAERPKPVLGQQPPLPGASQAAIRYVSPDQEDSNALVPAWPYYEEAVL